MIQTTGGVRKINELITQPGRTLIITEEDSTKLSWSDIPDGTLKVNPKSGIMSVKLEGETDWVPAGIKNDGTLSIARDSKVVYEIFTIKEIDTVNSTFVYTNESGDQRHSNILVDKTAGTTEYVFEVEKDTYMVMRNLLNVKINDTLLRNAASGGLREISNKRFSLYDDLKIGDEITVQYAAKLNVGNPYPRIFVSKSTPEDAEEGDLWIDMNTAPYALTDVPAASPSVTTN